MYRYLMMFVVAAASYTSALGPEDHARLEKTNQALSEMDGLVARMGAQIEDAQTFTEKDQLVSKERELADAQQRQAQAKELLEKGKRLRETQATALAQQHQRIDQTILDLSKLQNDMDIMAKIKVLEAEQARLAEIQGNIKDLTKKIETFELEETRLATIKSALSAEASALRTAEYKRQTKQIADGFQSFPTETTPPRPASSFRLPVRATSTGKDAGFDRINEATKKVGDALNDMGTLLKEVDALSKTTPPINRAERLSQEKQLTQKQLRARTLQSKANELIAKGKQLLSAQKAREFDQKELMKKLVPGKRLHDANMGLQTIQKNINMLNNLIFRLQVAERHLGAQFASRQSSNINAIKRKRSSNGFKFPSNVASGSAARPSGLFPVSDSVSRTPDQLHFFPTTGLSTKNRPQQSTRTFTQTFPPPSAFTPQEPRFSMGTRSQQNVRGPIRRTSSRKSVPARVSSTAFATPTASAFSVGSHTRLSQHDRRKSRMRSSMGQASFPPRNRVPAATSPRTIFSPSFYSQQFLHPQYRKAALSARNVAAHVF